MKVLQSQLLAAKVQVEDLKSEKKTVEELKNKGNAVDEDIEASKEEVDSMYALDRLTAKAALMRQHVRGLNPMARAQEELDTYLLTVGSEEDLDKDDKKDG